METKHPHTKEIAPKDASPIIALFFEFAQLKNLYRQGWLRREIPKTDCETDADHSFCVALLGYMIAEEYRPDLDAKKAALLGLFHELGEIHTGDLTPVDGVSLEDKSAREYSSVKKVFSHLPVPERYIAIWKEYDDGKTPEAIFIQQIDKLEMAFQAGLYERLGYKNLDAFFPYVQERLSSEELRPILEEIILARQK